MYTVPKSVQVKLFWPYRAVPDTIGPKWGNRESVLWSDRLYGQFLV